MAKKEFGNINRKKKITDEKINQVADEVTEETKPKREGTERFAFRIPISKNKELEAAAQKLGMSKKAIVMLGLNRILEELK